MTLTAPTVTGLYVGASGFSYATWKGGFYPEDAKPRDFLRLYAEQLPTVELNNTFYRLPSEDQFRRWAAATPDGFRFAVKMTMSITHFGRLDALGTFCERIRALGDRLGPVVVRLPDERPRDDGWLRLVLDSVDDDLAVAFDFRHPSWEDADALLAQRSAVRVGAVAREQPFWYLRLREPPYADERLAALARDLRPLLATGRSVYCYFKHEDEPTAPRYARRLAELLAQM